MKPEYLVYTQFRSTSSEKFRFNLKFKNKGKEHKKIFTDFDVSHTLKNSACHFQIIATEEYELVQ